MKKTLQIAFSITVLAVALASLAPRLGAHCDNIHGPLIVEAQSALAKGEVTPLLKWIPSGSEDEIRASFASAVKVRKLGTDAKEMADRHFIETLVRLHRAAEGAPFTGVKDEPIEPAFRMADEALAKGSADEMIKEIAEEIAGTIQAKFNEALEARKNKDKSVEAGRSYVAAYVRYMHHVEAIHMAAVALEHSHE